MALFSKIFSKLRSGSVSAADWDELERNLVEADLGAKLASEIITIAKKERLESAEASVVSALGGWLTEQPRELAKAEGRPTTILVVGVNGTGKTTSVAKLASRLAGAKYSVIVAAADTFRAAATEQLQTWGDRLGIPVVTGKVQADPASVSFDAATKAVANGNDYLIIDTAGRLHTKSGLMDELGKIRRVVEKVTPIDEVLLVVDATTGQNGIAQSKIFAESVAVTGLIVTKMDGSARGGIALAIEKETGLPIKFIGVGESAADFKEFDRAEYLHGLIAD